MAGVPAGSAAELVQTPQGNVSFPGSLPPDAGEAPRPAAGPDERPLWRLLSAGRLHELDDRLAALRTDYPAWQPPPRMQALLGHAETERDLARFKAAGDWAAVRRLASDHPDLATCGRPDDDAVVAAAPGAASSLATSLAGCADDAARVALLAAAFDRFGDVPGLRNSLDRLDTPDLPDTARTRLAQLRTDLAVQALGHDLAAHAPGALSNGAALRELLASRREARLQAGLGWAALNASRPADAVSWFEAAKQSAPGQDVSAGLARALLASGREAEGRTLLATTPGGAATLAALDDARLQDAFRRGAYAQAAFLAAREPDPSPVLGWSLFRLHRFDDAAAAFEARFRRHGDDAAAEGLILSLLEAGRLDDAAAAGPRLGGAVADRLWIGSDLGYRLALLQLRRALDHHDGAEAARLAAVLAGPVRERGDADGAAALGWAALDTGHPADARTWFARGVGDDAAYGEALATLKNGDPATAAQDAASHGTDGRWRRLRLDATMAVAQAREDASPGDPAAADAARTVLAEDPARRDAALLLGWNDVHAGHRTDGAAVFEALYRQDPDASVASALATAEPDRTRLDQLGAELGGPLAAAIQHRAAQDAYDRKEFAAAERIDPGFLPFLANVDAPAAGLSATYRSKSGQPGTSQLDSTAGDVFASVPSGADRVTVRLHLLSLDAGRGGVPGTTTRLPLGVEPSVSWAAEATGTPLLSPFATLGTSPIGGRIAPTPTGHAGVGWQAGDLTLRGTLSRESVTESLLSFTGITDGATGRTFGRVTETGGKVEGYLQLAPRWGLYVDGGTGVRTGSDVHDNTHVQAAASVSYDLRVPGFDTFTLGPSYGFSGFARDLSGFTPGQGGYYSPRSLHLLGAALRMLTLEGQNFSVRASAFAGWQFARSDGAANGSGGRFPASRQDGFNATGEVTAAYRLTDSWFLGGMVRYQVSPQFNDLYVGLSLTRSFGSRPAVVSADLPQFDLR